MELDNGNQSRYTKTSCIELECPACGGKEFNEDNQDVDCTYLICNVCGWDCVK